MKTILFCTWLLGAFLAAGHGAGLLYLAISGGIVALIVATVFIGGVVLIRQMKDRE